MKPDTRASGGSAVSRRCKQARPNELRDAALALFVERGFDATSTAEIASRAGVSKGTLYLYYRSKESLLRAVMDSPVLDALLEPDPELARARSSADTLRRALSRIREKLSDEAVGQMLRLALAEARRFPEFMESWQRKVLKPMHAQLVEAIRQGIDREEFRVVEADDAARSLLTPAFMAMVVPHPAAEEAARQCLDDGFFAQHVELVIRALRR